MRSISELYTERCIKRNTIPGIHQKVIEWCNLDMDIQDIRRANLQRIVDAITLAEAARRFGKPDRQLNDMLHKRKPFGEKVAAAMESAYGLEPGALSSAPYDAPASGLLLLPNSKEIKHVAESTPTFFGFQAKDIERYERLTAAGKIHARAKFLAGIEEAEQRFPAKKTAS